MSELFEQIDALRRVEGRAALATLVSTHGTTPRKEGAKMWVGEDGRILGSVPSEAARKAGVDVLIVHTTG